MSRVEKIAFLVMGLGSILYFMLQEFKANGIALEGGAIVILTLIMSSIALFAGAIYVRKMQKQIESKAYCLAQGASKSYRQL